MSFLSDDQFAELRSLFFEGALELIQSLNEDGMQFEKTPQDVELQRRIRRTVHTLKGDSAAAGFSEMSDLAHELEDVLTAEAAAASGSKIAEAVLQVADAFGEMLSSYRSGATPNPPAGLRDEIRSLLESPSEALATPASETRTSQSLTEYERLALQEAERNGESVLDLAIEIDPLCPPAVALQMVRNAVQQAGTILAISPDHADAPIAELRVTIATHRDEASIANICRIPAVVAGVRVTRVGTLAQPETPTSSAIGLEPAAVPHQPDTTNDVLELGDGGALSHVSADHGPEAPKPTLVSDKTMRVDASRIDEALNLVGELILGKSMLMQSLNDLEERFARDPLTTKFSDAIAFQSRVLSDLQKSVMKIRMVPVAQLFRRFPRVARDLAKACGKEIELEISGESTDLDKGILDSLAEPLSHLVRNAIDHGIESPEERVAQGKPRAGKLLLTAYHQGNHIVIECADDGRGIDRHKLTEKAIAAGVLAAGEALPESEALGLIFRPGLSTAEHVTRISGRGVGMDVVKTVVERLKGSVHVESQVGKGSTFRIRVPLTLAIIKALMFRVCERLYAVPLASVVEIARVYPSEIHRVDQHEVLQLRDEVLTLVRLDRLHKRQASSPAKFFVIVITHGERKFGLIVDRLVGEEEMVIKALDDHLVATDYVSGASILGDGSVVLILNIQAVAAKLSRVDAAQLEVSA